MSIETKIAKKRVHQNVDPKKKKEKRRKVGVVENRRKRKVGMNYFIVSTWNLRLVVFIFIMDNMQTDFLTARVCFCLINGALGSGKKLI